MSISFSNGTLGLDRGTALYDDSYHRIFVTTNEANHGLTLNQLAKAELRGNTLVGVSGFATLNMAVQRPFDWQADDCPVSIVMVDRGKRVKEFWETIIPLIRESSTQFEFQEKLETVYEENEQEWGKGVDPANYSGAISDLYKEKGKKLSWLSSGGSFNKIKKIALQNKLIFFAADLTQPHCIDNLRSFLATHEKTVDTLYVSNVQEYVEPESSRFETLVNSVDLLLADSHGYLVTTNPRTDKSHSLTQTVVPYSTREDLRSKWGIGGQSTFHFPAPAHASPVITPLIDLAAESMSQLRLADV